MFFFFKQKCFFFFFQENTKQEVVDLREEELGAMQRVENEGMRKILRAPGMPNSNNGRTNWNINYEGQSGEENATIAEEEDAERQ